MSGRTPPGEGAGVRAMRLPQEQGRGQAAVETARCGASIQVPGLEVA